MENTMKTDYKVRCLGTGEILSDESLPLENSNAKEPALLRAEYGKIQLSVGDESRGLYRFADWLPIRRFLEGSGAPVTYKSEGLAAKLDLTNLYITFNGYWPERGARMLSGTFKECEAYSVCARMPEGFDKTLVVASVGNTSRAFTRVCSANKIPLVVVVPERNLDSMWFVEPVDPCVTLIAAGGDSDYFDAIRLADLLCKTPGFIAEGGAKNIARRDGMGTTVLSAVTSIGEIPDYYFQAVGSGTGAIAAWEANLRFIGDGRFGNKKMKLFVSQNDPFLLIRDSWKQGKRELAHIDPETARSYSDRIIAKVLSNRKPPYSIIGGLYDALVDTGGDVLGVTNNEAMEAAALFEETEGIDVAPAASVAVGSLVKAVKERSLDSNALVMLNITGGGMNRIKARGNITYLEPLLRVPREKIMEENIQEIVDTIMEERK